MLRGLVAVSDSALVAPLVEVEATFLPPESGGRSRPPALPGYRPHFVVDGTIDYLGVVFTEADAAPEFGKAVRAKAECVYDGVDYSRLLPGTRFNVVEGARVVAHGVVLRLVSRESERAAMSPNPSVTFREELRRYVTLARQLVAELEEAHAQPASAVLERWLSRDESPPPLRSGWRYNFHGLECRFTHPEGTVVDVALTTLRLGQLVVVDFAAAVPIDPGFLAEFCRTRPGGELRHLDFATASRQLDALGAQGEVAVHDGSYFSCT